MFHWCHAAHTFWYVSVAESVPLSVRGGPGGPFFLMDYGQTLGRIGRTKRSSKEFQKTDSEQTVGRIGIYVR